MSLWPVDPPDGIVIHANVGLAALATMRVGGAAEFFARVTALTELSAVVHWARQISMPYLILGGGSNILVSDAGVRGLVIHNRCRQIEMFKPTGQREWGESSSAKNIRLLRVESGANMAGVARTSIRHALSGLEWAVSVPGTVGGAVVNNAGAHGSEVKDHLLHVQVLDSDGQERRRSVEQLGYGYRSSRLKSEAAPLKAGFGAVVLAATFRLSKGSASEAKERAAAFLNHRRSTQPVEPSLGSMFMNPAGDYAGRLIEAAGLKGTRVGNIEVSQQHANFLIHPGTREGSKEGGRAADVLALIRLIQNQVEMQFGVRLIPEVQLVGEWE